MSLKFVACYITCQWGELRVKNATLSAYILYLAFFFVFYQKICVFVISISFFDKVSNLHNRILLNNQETEIDDKKLSVEMLVTTDIFNNCKSFALQKKKKNAHL